MAWPVTPFTLRDIAGFTTKGSQMSAPKLGVVAVGNALVDVLAHADEEFIASKSSKWLLFRVLF